MKTIALYARVSTKTQNPETQLVALREHIRRRWPDERIESIEYVDVCSGAKRTRPHLDQMMRDARRHRFEAVIVTRFDRFARSAHHLVFALEEFENLRISFLSINEAMDTTTSVGRATFWIIGALAEMERGIIGERIREGLERARKEGKTLGRPKRIFDRDNVRQLHQGGQTVREIAEELKISKDTVHRSLKTPSQNPVAHFATGAVSGNTLRVPKRRLKTK